MTSMPLFYKPRHGDRHNIINLRNFTTEDTEFHGGKMIFVSKTPCSSVFLRGFFFKYTLMVSITLLICLNTYGV